MIQFAQSTIGSESVNDDNITVTLTGVTAGNCLVAVSYGGSDLTHTYSDDKSGSWSTVVKQYQSNDGGMVSIGYAPDAAGGDTAVTAVFSAANVNKILAILEYSGVAVVSPLSQQANAQGDFTVVDPGTITPAVDGEVIIAAAKCASEAPIFTSAGSFNERHEVSPFGPGLTFCVEDYIQAVVAAITDFWSAPSDQRWAAIAISLKPATGGGLVDETGAYYGRRHVVRRMVTRF